MGVAWIGTVISIVLIFFKLVIYKYVLQIVLKTSNAYSFIKEKFLQRRNASIWCYEMWCNYYWHVSSLVVDGEWQRQWERGSGFAILSSFSKRFLVKESGEAEVDGQEFRQSMFDMATFIFSKIKKNIKPGGSFKHLVSAVHSVLICSQHNMSTLSFWWTYISRYLFESRSQIDINI